MTLGIDNKSLKVGFVVAAVLVALNFWSFQLVPDQVYKLLEAALSFCVVIIAFYNYKAFNKKTFFRANVWLFLALPLLSALGAYFFHDQSVGLSLLVLRPNLFWLFYFVLHAFSIDEEKILRIMLFAGAVWAILTIVQQFTFPTYYFYTRSESDTYSIYRAGVYRFMLAGVQYGSLMLLYAFYQFLTKKKKSYLPYIFLGLLGLYFYGTRQYAIAAVGCMVLSVFILKGNARITALAAIFFGSCVLLFFKDALFGEYIEMTSEQFQEDNIRELAGDFFLNEYWPSWGAKLVGNGPPHMLSNYGQEMDFITSYYHFNINDVGIIGAYSTFGIFYVLNILHANFKGLFCSIKSDEKKYLKLYFLFRIIVIVTNVAYASFGGIAFYCLLFYLVDKAIESNQSTNNSEAGTVWEQQPKLEEIKN